MTEGVVALIKPPGLSSNTASNLVRNILGASKAGHTGTLDVGASGVLAVCLGRATKYVDKLMDTDKRYVAEVTFGIATDTQDAYGVVTDSSDAIVTEADIASVLPRFIGSIEQRTPLYSAAKQDGVPLYKLARSGKEIREKLRTVQITSIDVLRRTGDNSFLLDICCGKGTYIRTLAADIGTALHVPAYMSFLLRTRTSGLDISGAYTIAELRAMVAEGRGDEAVIPVEKLAE